MIPLIIEYKVLLKNGTISDGVFRGSKKEFQNMIAKQNLTVVSILEKKPKIDNSKFNNNDFTQLIEELYYLTQSGMSIDNSIKMLIESTKKNVVKKILENVIKLLNNGSQLSLALQESFKKENIQVDELSFNFISTSEEIGDLSTGLKQLFDYLSFQQKVRKDVKQALSYPIFLFGMSIVVTLLIFFLIIPKFSTIFSPEEFEKLPSLSYYVLSLGKYVNANAMEIFFVISILIFLLIYFFKKSNISLMNLLYKIPYLSELIISLQLSIVYSALSSMLTGGLELDRALKHLAKMNLIPDIKNLLVSALVEIKKGEKLSSVFSISRIIPSSDIALLHVGENSASLNKIFSSLSKRHSENFDSKVKKILGLLEPAVIVLLGVFIAIIVVSIMMAVMSLTDIAG